MRGSKRERRPNVWELRCYVGGTKRQVSRTHHGNEDSAETALCVLVAEVMAGGHHSRRGDVDTIADLLARWLEDRAPDWSPKTLETNTWMVKKHLGPRFGHMTAADVRPSELSKVYRQLATEVGIPTARLAHSLLSSAYSEAVKDELLDANPCTKARLPKAPAPQHRAVTLADVRRVLELARKEGDPGMALLIRLAAISGARRGELAGLRWTDVDTVARTVTVERAVVVVDGELIVKSTKSEKVKVVALDDATLAGLAAWKDSAGAGSRYVWESSPGVPLTPDTITARWRRLAKRAKVDARLHDVRHANASHMLAHGVGIADAAARLGHTPDVLVKVYAHQNVAGDAAVADMLAEGLDA